MSYFVHSQIWMALSGLALIASVGHIHNVSLKLNSALIIFFGLMWVYLLDATASHSPEDETNQRARLQFFRKHAKALGFLRLVSLVVSLYLALSLNLPRESWFFLVAAAVSSWIYSVGFRGRRIKTSSLNKTWIIALAWTAGVLGSLWALEFMDLKSVSPGLVLALVAILFFDTALLDWRDQRGDIVHGVSSIFTAKILSVKTHLILGVLLMLGGLGYLLWAQDKASTYLVTSYLISFNIVVQLAKRTRSAAAFSFWVSAWRMAGLWVFI